jgi:type IV fimbrial biogenesis protein FimT
MAQNNGHRWWLGLSLVEVLVVVAVLGLLAATTLPLLSGFLDRLRLVTYNNDVLVHLAHARHEAIRRGHRVVMCKSADGLRCAQTGHWHQGWLVFVDPNNNAQLDSGEEVLRQQAALPPGWVVRGNTPVARYVSYHPIGLSLMVSGAFQAGTFTVCKTSAAAVQARQVVISSNGRPRSQTTQLNNCQ